MATRHFCDFCDEEMKFDKAVIEQIINFEGRRIKIYTRATDHDEKTALTTCQKCLKNMTEQYRVGDSL